MRKWSALLLDNWIQDNQFRLKSFVSFQDSIGEVDSDSVLEAVRKEFVDGNCFIYCISTAI